MRKLGDSARVKGPCIEGVAYYPKLDENLRLTNKKPMWVSGDATGIFRGIVAAMISGFYVGDEIGNFHKNNTINSLIETEKTLNRITH